MLFQDSHHKKILLKLCILLTSDPPDFPVILVQIIRHQPSHMSANAVPNEVHIIRLHPSRMMRNILDQLRYATAGKTRTPLHLAEAGFLHCRAVVHNDDVVIATLEVRFPDIRAGRQIPTTAKPMDHNLDRMCRVPHGVEQRFGVEHVQLLAKLLGLSRVQEEVDLRMRTPVRLLQTRRGVKHILRVIGLLSCKQMKKRTNIF
jgi:hypothetical protein